VSLHKKKAAGKRSLERHVFVKFGSINYKKDPRSSESVVGETHLLISSLFEAVETSKQSVQKTPQLSLIIESSKRQRNLLRPKSLYSKNRN